MPRKLTLNEFLQRSKKVHGDKYDYSKVKYINNSTKVCIICPEHGEFWQTPANHMIGCGCKKCGTENKSKNFSLGFDLFLKKAKEVHGNRYDYSKVDYINNRTKVCIICPEHGEFLQTPDKHLSGQGCPKCCKKNRKYTESEFIKKAKEVHGNKYDYSKTIYGKNHKDKVCIICPEHGEFWQTPALHLNGSGCIYCNKGNVFDTKDFIKISNKVHKNKYDYSKTIYKKSLEKVCIICPDHGEFWQNPSHHLNGCGCPICSKKYRKGEMFLFEYLKNKFCHLTIIHSYKDKKILGRQEIDIYIPKYKIGIEYQGEQHFKPVDFGGDGENLAKKVFKLNQERDKMKNKKCKENGITIYYFSETKNDSFLGEKVFHRHEELYNTLIENIKKRKNKPHD